MLAQPKYRVFLAWSGDTKHAAETIRACLQSKKVEVWWSDDTAKGEKFREEARRQIRSADLVVAIFPSEPSPWFLAEAGLAYFEEKVLPVTIDDAKVCEPFGAFQASSLSSQDLEDGDGASVHALVRSVETRLGLGEAELAGASTVRFFNGLFFAGTPTAGAVIISSLLVIALLDSDSYRSLELWKAGHTVWGAIFFGGAAFLALLFSRAGTSNSVAERHFEFLTGRYLFYIWMLIAIDQLVVGLLLINIPAPSLSEAWIIVAIVAYMASLLAFFLGYDVHRSAWVVNVYNRQSGKANRLTLAGNLCFGLGLLLVSIVVVLMSLRRSVDFPVF